MKFFVVLLFLTLSVAKAADWPNDPFYLPYDASTNVGPVDVMKAMAVSSQLQKIYANEFSKQQHPNYSLALTIDWTSPYFAAFSNLVSNPDSTNNFIGSATVWGGYIRVPEMTESALAATFCHELGHHFGGQPRQQAPLPEWSSSEGQADYYAAHVCLPRWFQVATESQKPKVFEPQILKACGRNELCQLVAQAGYEFVKVIHRYSYQNLPALSLTIPDSLKVEQTLRNTYPSYQCRLDTFLMAANDFALNNSLVIKKPVCWFKD